MRKRTATCPHCGLKHTIKYGKSDSNISELMGFVKCPYNNKSYVVTTDGKEDDKNNSTKNK